MKKSKTYFISLTSLFTALAVVIGLIEIPWVVPWLKLDFSEIIILISVFIIGYFKTIPVIIIRSLIRFLLIPGINIPFPFFNELIAIFASLVLATLFFVSLKVVNSLKKETYKETLFLFLMWLLIVIISVVLSLISIYITTPMIITGGKYFVLKKELFANLENIGKIPNTYNEYLNYMIMLYFPFNVIKYFITIVLFYLTNKTLKLVKMRRLKK